MRLEVRSFDAISSQYSLEFCQLHSLSAPYLSCNWVLTNQSVRLQLALVLLWSHDIMDDRKLLLQLVQFNRVRRGHVNLTNGWPLVSFGGEGFKCISITSAA